MSFAIEVPRRGKDPINHSIQIGEVLFVLGPNGTGKSNLMQRIYSKHKENARRISAHRPTTIGSNVVTLTAQQKKQSEANIKNHDANPASRWSDRFPSQRTDVAIYDLIDAQIARDRNIAAMVDGGSPELSDMLKEGDIPKEIIRKILKASDIQAPIEAINELLKSSNLAISISVHENSELLASKSGSESFSISELSDGERNAILLAAEMLTVPSESLIVIDEPERHLHRSIISPLLTQLVSKRSDCAFVVSTHDVMLPIDNPDSQTLLLRSCVYEKKNVSAWEADILRAHAPIDDELKKDILGARSIVLFVEGEENSLDKALFSLVLPDVSLVPKANCREVMRAVAGIRGTADFHWIHAFGIIDNDGRTEDEIKQLKAQGIYPLAVSSVESIYYHPKVQKKVTEGHSEITGEDAQDLVQKAKIAALDAIGKHKQRLSERAIERALREQVCNCLPNSKDIADGEPISIEISVVDVVASEKCKLDKAIDEKDLEFLIARYPVRETPALDNLVEKLRFKDRNQYESAVRRLLIDDKDTLMFVKSLLGGLSSKLGVD